MLGFIREPGHEPTKTRVTTGSDYRRSSEAGRAAGVREVATRVHYGVYLPDIVRVETASNEWPDPVAYRVAFWRVFRAAETAAKNKRKAERAIERMDDKAQSVAATFDQLEEWKERRDWMVRSVAGWLEYFCVAKGSTALYRAAEIVEDGMIKGRRHASESDRRMYMRAKVEYSRMHRHAGITK